MTRGRLKMLQYDDNKHEYRYKGVVIPSVTQVLPKIDFHMSESKLEVKRLEGKDTHSKIKMFFDTGDDFNDPFLMMLGVWMKTNKKLTGKLVQHEGQLFSKKHLFGGTPDMVFEEALVDWKSSLYAPKHFSLQLAGYNILTSENKVIGKTKKWIILYPDGGVIKMKNVYNSLAEDVFIASVRKWQLERTIENYMKG